MTIEIKTGKPGDGMKLDVIPMRRRIFLRTLRYVAYHWTVPFLAGCAAAVALFTLGEVHMAEGLERVFIESFETVVASCAQ